MMISRFAIWFFALTVPTLAGCSAFDTCPEGPKQRVVAGGSSDVEGLYYDSSGGWDVPLTSFPPKTTLIFEHGLGVTPLNVLSYVSFNKNGTRNNDDEHEVTENAGNQGHIECVDSQVIHMSNDTCEENLFIRVTASGQTTNPAKPCSEEL
jgi:hypothetical protein